MRFWRAVGDASLIFLYVPLALGPATRFLPSISMLLPYRRDLGVWFGIFAIVHTIIIFDGWVQWEVFQFMGYQFVSQLLQMVRLESGFGMANILGLLAVLMALPLMATSADWATRKLGGSSWKFLLRGAYTIFYPVALHTAYFLSIHYTVSFITPYPFTGRRLLMPTGFQIPFAVFTMAVLILQIGDFFKTMGRQRRETNRRAMNASSSTLSPALKTEEEL